MLKQGRAEKEEKMSYLAQGWQNCEDDLKKEISHLHQIYQAQLDGKDMVIDALDAKCRKLSNRNDNLLNKFVDQGIELKWIKKAFQFLFEREVKMFVDGVNDDDDKRFKIQK